LILSTLIRFSIELIINHEAVKAGDFLQKRQAESVGHHKVMRRITMAMQISQCIDPELAFPFGSTAL